MSGERINNTLRNNGIAGGVFSFSLNDLLNGNGNGNGTAASGNGSGNGNATGNNNTNGNTTGPIQFTSLGDTIANAFQTGGTGQGMPDIAAIVNNVVQSLNNAVTDPHANHRRATQRALDALKPLHLDEIPAEARSSNCPICYEPYVEYESSSEEHHTSAEASSPAVNITPSQQQQGTSQAEEILVGPWKGYDLTDPSISFPAIETATYQHTYSLAAEPDLGLDAEPTTTQIPATTTSTDTPLSDSNNEEEEDVHYAVKLPQCNHIFGRPCIVEWLQSNVSCPLCRREIVPELTEDTRTSIQPSSDGPQSSERTFIYDTAITETYVPVDWTAPMSSGYILSDPPLTLPVPGIGMSSGRRTGRDP